MESLVFILFLTVVFVAWMGQVTQPRWCVRRVRHQSVLAVRGQQFVACQGRRTVVYSCRTAQVAARTRDRSKDSGRGRPLLHLN